MCALRGTLKLQFFDEGYTIATRRILGVDPGSQITGFALIDVQGVSLSVLDLGCVRLDTKASFPERLGEIYTRLSEVIQTWNPSEMAIEDVFMHKSAQSALKLGQARGAAIVAGRAHDLPVAEYSPKEVKQAVTGTGAADKKQIQTMLMTMLNLQEVPQADAADALGVAVCHSNQMNHAALLDKNPALNELKTLKRSGNKKRAKSTSSWRSYTP